MYSRKDPLRSQWSCQTLIEWPSPTNHRIPSRSSSAPRDIAVYMWDLLVDQGPVNKVAWGKYFALRSRAHREEGVEYRRQAWFMRIAWFLCRVDVIPNPPASLGSVTVSQLIVWHPLRPLVSPQRKWQLSLSMCWQNFWGRIAVCMAYSGTEETEALMRVARPAMERYLACHPSIRLRILSTRYWYALVVRRVEKIGVLR